MYQFLRPKFRFGLFMVESNKTNFYKNQNSNPHQPVICHADNYEIKEDGSIVFYQTIRTAEDKRFKVPVLSYPHGKWEACVLLDDTNEFPVFKGYTNVAYREPVTPNNSQEPETEEESNNASPSDIDQLDEMFGTNIVSSPNNQQANNPNIGVNTNPSEYSSPLPSIAIQGGYSVTQNTGMPGINNPNNPQEFKKQKEEWLSNEIKKYSRDANSFVITEFLSYIGKQSQNKTYRINETDVVWSASRLIRNKAVMSRKFAEPLTQKTLALILPDIMKRQWDGKMATILQILQEREETKNVNAIDLAVWMAQNNFD